ncbi:FRIGIDA-like protein 3 [Iris pallida]|uniref:FRIGIDA-like protein n=1 Tax=Iris pallida TaxID=29817 RepID=A0AAX6FXK8_IRIPA|nr:FRIGIDA-like protein 3 [Iris pallida]
MDETHSVATLFDSTTFKIQQLQQAFSELESHNAVSLNVKWKELEEHFHGLEKSLKKKIDDLADQEKEYVSKASETQKMLENQEAFVVTKELASLERLQDKRDTVISAIFENYNSPSESVTNGVSNELTETMVVEKSDVKAATSDLEDANHAKDDDLDVNPCSQLIELCKGMDAEGLHKYISDNRKNLASIREEIPLALQSATNPFNLVLHCLKDFYSGETLGIDGKKDANLLGLRRTCLMLMESLSLVVADAISFTSFSDNMLTPEIKDQAKMIANEWKSKIDNMDIDAGSGNSLEVHAFLQLLATFSIVSEFDQDEICKLIPAVSRRRQAADLCRSLGFLEKMPGVITLLVNSGRQIEGVNLAYAFELTEQFAPVPLLKAYLKEVRKVSQVKAGSVSPGAQLPLYQNETNERELSALKAVIKCIEDHKLEEQYPVDPLQKRILQLEKAKADKRRAAEAAKPQSKRPRANGSTYNARVTSFPPDKSFYRAPERYTYSYDRQYIYPAEGHPPQMMATATYTISPPHATYYSNGYPVQYQATYIQ